ncbi:MULTISPECIES: DUF4333 domain-containing protein [Prauserella salsuginis group]|uniref:DUF4333 domain-containing protein n=1 Tax=Prauserella salsuginis TaxID=387889 RepID=A0ABW6GC33_9PSEU|nr:MULTISPECIES: DUF4333 domain-containing protein [Prauserella salsuginis group]MCR3719358.1 protein of unknown function (DUF4333) [Prauserella flava]MCR3735628.1 protein of unknown function (DUF4333) [Prauserella salsuginis]
MSRLARVVFVPVACAALALTGCSFEFSVGSTVGKDELEKQVMGALSEQDRRPKDVTCPDDLEPEVDATTTCTSTGQDGVQRDAKVTVTEVGEDDRVQFDVVLSGGDGDGQAGGDRSTAPDATPAGDDGRASDAPAGDEIDRAVLAREAARSLSREAGQHLGEVGCPEHVEATVGASTRCVLTNPAGTRFGVTVEVTEVDAETQNANFHVQVDAQPLSGGR